MNINTINHKTEIKKINTFYNLFVEIYSEHSAKVNELAQSDFPKDQRGQLVHSLGVLMVLSEEIRSFQEAVDEIDRVAEIILERFGCDPDRLEEFKKTLRQDVDKKDK